MPSLIVFCVVFALEPMPKSDTHATELQGAWRLTAVEAAAGKVELPEARPLLTVSGDRLFFGGEEFARLTADRSTEPKVFDLRFTEPERIYEGIYELRGKDIFQVCLNGRTEGVKERPNSFSLDEQPVRRLLTFERAKPEEATAGNGFVGMALRFDETLSAVVIQSTLERSPARKAGLREDDVLLSVGGDAVTDLRSAINAVRRIKPRTELPIRVRRDGKDREVKVTIAVVPFEMLTGLD
jgi:uncharacterized protein (TIGR03067 family)